MFNELYCWNEFVWKRWERKAKVGKVFCMIEVTSDLFNKKAEILHMCGHMRNTHLQACSCNEEEHARKCFIFPTVIKTNSWIWYLQREQNSRSSRTTLFGRSHLKVTVVLFCQSSYETTAPARPEAGSKRHPGYTNETTPKAWKNTFKPVGGRFIFWAFVCLYNTNHYYSSLDFIIKLSGPIGF